MKLTFLSNYLTHHQIPVCNALYRKFGDNFHFIATQPMREERIKMGWQLSETYPYVVCGYGETKATAESVLFHSDIIILGNCSENWEPNVLSSEAEFILLYSERIFKKGAYQRFGSGAKKYKAKIEQLIEKKTAYFLCASAYLPTDLKQMGLGKNRYLRWGYFPSFFPCDDLSEMLRAKKPSSILWAGRFLDWKHPEDAVFLASKLKKAGYDFCMNIIGDGEKRGSLQSLIEKKSLRDRVRIIGFLSPEKVRDYMQQADIYLFTSDRYEGWGAVANEAMNAGCAVVANKAIGSVPFLIQQQENGIIYNRKFKNDLFKKVCFLLDHPAEKATMQSKAYETIETLWNAEIAATRLIAFAEALKNGQEITFDDGPCSKADIL